MLANSFGRRLHSDYPSHSACNFCRIVRAVPVASRARACLSLSLSLTHMRKQIHTHKHKREHKHTTGTRNSERSYTQSELMLSFTRAMSLACVLACTLYAERFDALSCARSHTHTHSLSFSRSLSLSLSLFLSLAHTHSRMHIYTRTHTRSVKTWSKTTSTVIQFFLLRV